MSEIKYTIKHVGMNHPNEEAADQTRKELMDAFGLETGSENQSAVFVGTIFEVMKHDRRGTVGHLALQTEDVEAAMADLSSRGYGFKMETARRDENGKINFVFLEKEFGGYAIHLTT